MICVCPVDESRWLIEFHGEGGVAWLVLSKDRAVRTFGLVALSKKQAKIKDS
ncbi:MAG: hypothetical protein ABR979_07675 [Halobacteriota archaeon]|jgi:hypothetical protein